MIRPRRISLRPGRAACLMLALVLAALLVLPMPPPSEATAAAGAVRWGYHVNFDSNSGLTSLRAHIGKLTHLSPRWYLVDAAGTLTPAPDPNRAAIIALARGAGVKLLPYVRNTAKYDDLTPFLSSPEARATAVANITNAVMAEDFDGIHVDFEEINGADRDRLTQFIAELAAAMHARGKLMSQAMGPKTADTGSSWAAGWDYAALGKLNDLVVIMAYTAPGRAPHPIAAAAWAEANVAYAVSRIPREKVLLGIPLYGYDWNITTGATGEAITGPQALARAAAAGVTPQWNETEQEYTFAYTRDGQQRRVWYSDRRSVEVRLGLVGTYRTAGAAFWRIGQEEPGVWDALTPAAPPAPASTPTPAPAAATATAAPALTPTPAPAVAETATPTTTPTPVATATLAVTATATPRPPATPTGTPTPPPTATATLVPTETATPHPPSTATAPPTTTPLPSPTATLTAAAVAPRLTETGLVTPEATPGANAPPAAAQPPGPEPVPDNTIMQEEALPGGILATAALSIAVVVGVVGAGVRRLRRRAPASPDA